MYVQSYGTPSSKMTWHVVGGTSWGVSGGEICITTPRVGIPSEVTWIHFPISGWRVPELLGGAGMVRRRAAQYDTLWAYG